MVKWQTILVSKGRSFSNVFEGEIVYDEFLRKIYTQVLNYRTNIEGNIYAHAFVLFIEYIDYELSWMLARQKSIFPYTNWDYKAITFK